MSSSVPRLKELRKEFDYTQRKVERLIGAGNHAVYDWENGKSEPNILMLMCLADIFQTSIDYLVGRSDKR